MLQVCNHKECAFEYTVQMLHFTVHASDQAIPQQTIACSIEEADHDIHTEA